MRLDKPGLTICLALLACWTTLFFLCIPALAGEAPPKNLIVLIMDGCGDEHLTLARWFKGAPLALDSIRTGAVKSFIADGVIADSAPAASAYATGVRTGGTIISLGPPAETLPALAPTNGNDILRPRATVLEGARLLGKATGIVATSRISHATPAAFVAHVPQRSQEQDITEQAVYQNLDVVLGGGRRYLLPASAGGARQDEEDLAEVLNRRNYQLITDRPGMERLKQPKVFGLFAMSHLEPEIDRRQAAPHQPSLAEMTRKAIELLANNPRGFLLMVEGSQIDWASHAHDPAHLLGDLLIFDAAVQAALDFARADGQTLVLALPDHNTGGLSIGNHRSDTSYARLQPDELVKPLRNMRCSAPALWRRLGPDKTPEKIMEAVKTHWGLDLSLQDARQILELSQSLGKEGHYALGRVIGPKYTYLGWTTHGHTGGDIPLFAFGPHRPIGLLDAPDIGRVSAQALGLDLEKLTDRLFVEARQAFPGGAVQLDRRAPHNPVLRITHENRQAALPVNKNLLSLDGKEIPLEGVVVYVPENDTIYLPRQAVHLIQGHSKPLPVISK